MTHDVWASGEAYEAYVGRWSRRVAARFVTWLALPAGRRWLDVGCGTGALTATVLAAADPAEVVGVDASAGFLATAVAGIDDPRVRFETADARSLPYPDDRFEAVVSGLVLNFVPDPPAAVAEWARVAAPGGVVATYVWDYADGMEFMRHFWDAAAEVDPAAADLDEGRRFPYNHREPLRGLWTGPGLTGVTVDEMRVPTVFRDFDDFWLPFLGGQGAAPGYLMSREEEYRASVRDLLAARLPRRPDGSIALTARVWAVRGTFTQP